MSFGVQGYNQLPSASTYSSNEGESRNKIKHFFFGKGEIGEQFKRRILFLDGHDGLPFGFWLHDHYVNSTRTRVQQVCLVKNVDNETGQSLAEHCPLCDHTYVTKEGEEKHWIPSFVGCFSVIKLGIVKRERREDGTLSDVIIPTEWTSGGKTYQFSFEREMLLLKRGSEKYPGILMTLNDLMCTTFATKDPNYFGVVCDVRRDDARKETVGNVWNVCTYNNQPVRLREDQLLKYLKKAGAPDNFNPEILKPFDYAEHWKPKTIAQLEQLLTVATAKAQASGVGYGSAPAAMSAPLHSEGAPAEEYPQYEDDIPF